MSGRVFSVFMSRFKNFGRMSFHIVSVRRLATDALSLTAMMHKKLQKFEPASNILLRYEAEGFFPWDRIKSEILDVWYESSWNINSIIFKGCLLKEKPEIALSFYKHLLEREEKPTLIDSYHLLINLKDYPEVIKGNKDLLLDVYRSMESDIKLHKFLRDEANHVFSYIEECWQDIYEGKSEEMTTDCPDTAVQVAFDNDKLEAAWEGLTVKNFNKGTMSSYLNYCFRRARAGEFDQSFLDRVVTFCQDNFRIFPNSSDFLQLLNDIFNAANEHPNGKFIWTANPCHLSKTNVCSYCNLHLKSLKMADEEWQELKKHFVDQVIVKHNIHMKSSVTELGRFLKVLENVKDYDVVMDGLNTHKKMTYAMEYFKSRNMRTFLIGRNHILRATYFKNAIRQSVGYFLTDNLSDDDVFTIYAAISRGPKTYVYTSDFFRGYGNNFKDRKLTTVFIKWQLLHQYRLIKNEIVKPLTHGTIPQKTMEYKYNQKYVYHISYSDIAHPRLTNMPSWVCVQGVPR